MTKQPRPIAEVHESGTMSRGNKTFPCYRVVDPTTKQPLKNRDGQFLDGGGQPRQGLAQVKADEINEFYLKGR